jgi:hypothetical protein
MEVFKWGSWMSTHNRYKQTLTCPECGRIGEVEFENDETPGDSDLRRNTRIVSLPEGFEKGQRQDDVFCADCETLIPH